MYALIIWSINAYGNVVNVVPNLSKSQCLLLEAVINKKNTELGNHHWINDFRIITACVEVPK